MPLASIERIEKTSDVSINGFTSSSPLMRHKTANNMKTFQSNAAAIINGMNTSSSTGSMGNALSQQRVVSSGLIIHGKDNARYIKFFTPSHADCSRAQEALNTYAFPGRRNLGYLFAFESRRAEVMASVGTDGHGSSGNQFIHNGTTNAMGASSPNNLSTRATPRRFDALVEFGRMGIGQPQSFRVRNNHHPHDGSRIETVTMPSPWRPILKANANYALCQSYPSILFGPASVDDSTPEGLRLIRKVAAFRSEGRTVALTWSSNRDGASLWRSAQPKVGLQGNRSEYDEQYLQKIASCAASARINSDSAGLSRRKPTREFMKMLTGCINESDLCLENFSTGSGSGGSRNVPIVNKCIMKIFDLRPKSAAMANRTAGYGYENTTYYPNTSLSFHNIGNIHAVRDSYQKISNLCTNQNVNDMQWAQLVEETKWLYHIRLILSVSWQAAFHVRYNRLPVLLHCSHGWDRTSQVAALSQLFLDEYYRTRAGFSCLIEKDFLAFGHPFHTRCGHGEGRGGGSGGGNDLLSGGGGGQGSGVDEGQICPIFIQFLDCVYQIVRQYPDYFEFNTKYLLLLSEHVYSCRFGTLLCDTERERELVASIRQRTHCLWEYLDSCPDLVNKGYVSKTMRTSETSIMTPNGVVQEDNNDHDDDYLPEDSGALLMPLPTLLRNVTLWVDRHCMHGPKPTLRCLPSDLSMSAFDQKNHPQHLMFGVDDGKELQLEEAREQAQRWKDIALAREQELLELKQKLKDGIHNHDKKEDS